MKWIKDLVAIQDNDLPVYLQISNAFTKSIREGRLRKGLKLPGTRQVAVMLKVNRMTVVAAYEELEGQGWIEMIPRKGAFIRTDLPELAPTRIIKENGMRGPSRAAGFPYHKERILEIPLADFPVMGQLSFNDGFPDVRLAPMEELTRSMRRISRLPSYKKYLMYGSSQGTVLLRETLSEFLSDTRGLPVNPENILITRGAQMGLYIAASMLITPGTEVIAGTPGYVDANLTFRQLGARINLVPVDDEGIDIDIVEKLCKKKKIRMLYVIPHHHNPTTVTLTPERRIRLLELAAKYKFAIIEDDYDYDFHYASKPLMPMASLDRHANVIYIGTLTKTFAPGIRVGFMVGPADLVATATHFRKYIDTQGDSLLENAIAELYKDGTIQRHIRKSVRLYRERRDYFCGLLQQELGDHISFRIPDGGMSVWTTFLDASLPAVSKRAMANGLMMKDGTGYDNAKVKYNSVRLGFASLDEREQARAVALLKKSL